LQQLAGSDGVNSLINVEAHPVCIGSAVRVRFNDLHALLSSVQRWVLLDQWLHLIVLYISSKLGFTDDIFLVPILKIINLLRSQLNRWISSKFRKVRVEVEALVSEFQSG
jgi:hypothetical protein